MIDDTLLPFDGNDLDRLRRDPLPWQSTISRLENAPSKTQPARLTGALVDQRCVSVTPGKEEIFDIDEAFCTAHGGQQLAPWNGHDLANAHLSCGERHAGCDDPEARQDAQGHGGADGQQACHAACPPALADDTPHLARRQPLRPPAA
jgi:hypothetical protein